MDLYNSKRLPCQGKNDLVLNYGNQSFWDQWANFYLHNLTGPPCCSCDGSLTVFKDVDPCDLAEV
ncbi:hypothetical protein Peur_051917 [Populus x canadensis]